MIESAERDNATCLAIAQNPKLSYARKYEQLVRIKTKLQVQFSPTMKMMVMNTTQKKEQKEKTLALKDIKEGEETDDKALVKSYKEGKPVKSKEQKAASLFPKPMSSMKV